MKASGPERVFLHLLKCTAFLSCDSRLGYVQILKVALLHIITGVQTLEEKIFGLHYN